jgi:hypothetical protein
MSNLRDAARQALEALNLCRDWPGAYDECSQAVTALRAALAEEALQRLTDVHQEIEAVLEQPVHGVTLKPVFYAPRRLSNEEVMAVIGPFRETEQEQEPKSTWQKLYEAAIDQRNEAVAEVKRLLEQPEQEQEQEPVALPCCGYTDASAIKWNPLNGVVQCHNCGQTFTHPPRREWRGLTEEDIWTLAANCLDSVLGRLHFARAIEATLKERNA